MIRNFFRGLWAFLKKHCVSINIGIFALAFFAQFTSAIPLLSGFMDHRSIVEAHDNDAGKMVEVGERSRWYNDNNFRYYGPLYFRIANTLHSMVPTSSGLYSLDSDEAREESVHFYLLLVSLLGLFLLAISCAFLASNRWEVRLLLSLFLSSLFLQHPVWSQYMLTAHPDHLLTGLAALATMWTLVAVSEGFAADKLRKAGIAWGATVATKLSSAFFIPGLLLLFFFFKKNTESFKISTKKIVLVALGAYFAFGFPQNFDVWGSVKKMLKLSEFSSAFTWGAFTDWWGYIFSQSYWPIIAIISFCIFLGGRQRNFKIQQNLLILLFLNLGVLILTLRTLELTHTYYAMPFIASLCVSMAFIFSQYSLRDFIFAKREPILFQLVLFIIFIVAAHFNVFQFKTLHKSQTQMLSCRENFREVYNSTKKVLEENKKIISTPYTPVPLKDEEAVKIDWELNFERVAERNPNLMVFNRAYYARYTDKQTPNKYVQITNSEWKDTQDFYLSFLDKSEVFHPRIGTWRRTYYDNCNLEIWVKD